MRFTPSQSVGVATGNPVVDAVAEIPISGNIIPASWYKTIRNENGAIDHTAISILGEIVYWYRPYEDRNGYTGEVIMRPKITMDFYRTSYGYLCDKFGDGEKSKKKIQRSLQLLEDLGIINRHFRTIMLSSGSARGNVMFIELIPDALRRVTFPVERNGVDADRKYEGEEQWMSDSGKQTTLVTPQTQSIASTGNDSSVSADKTMRPNTVTWSDLRIVENSTAQSSEASDHADMNDRMEQSHPAQTLWTPVSIANDLQFVENSFDGSLNCNDNDENNNATTCGNKQKTSSDPMDTSVHSLWTPVSTPYGHQCPHNKNTNKTTKEISTSLATPPDSSAYARDGEPAAEGRRESEIEDKAYRDFCRLFPGKVDKANAEKTWEAYEAAAAEVGADTVAAALKLNLKAYMEAPKGTVRDPYRYPLHWLEKYDGYAYWLMQLEKQRESGMPLDADGLPRVRFTLCRNGDEPAFWMTQLFSCDNRPVGGFEYLDEYETRPLSQRQAAERYLMSHPGQTVWAVFGKDEFCKIGPDGVPSTLNAFVAL